MFSRCKLISVVAAVYLKTLVYYLNVDQLKKIIPITIKLNILNFKSGGKTMKPFFLFIAIWSLLLADLMAQPVDTLWTAQYNGPGNGKDELVAMAVDNQNNIFVTGISVGSGTFEDMATIKYSPDGNILWEARYNSPGFSYDWPKAIAVDDSGNVVVLGSVYSDTTRRDFLILKYNSAGQLLWTSRYDGELHGYDWPEGLILDSLGNIYVTGNSAGQYGFEDALTIKYDRHGNQKWVSRINGTYGGKDGGNAITIDPSGRIVIGGYMSFANEDANFLVMVYNANGNMIWYQTFNGLGSWTDKIWDVTTDVNGYIYVTGESHGQGTDRDFLTVKYAPDGTRLWFTRYNGTGNGFDSAYKIAVDDSGCAYVSGKSHGGFNNGYDWVIIKYDSSGNQKWLYQMNSVGSMEDVPADMLLDKQERLWVTGDGFGDYHDFFTYCFDAHGNPIWQLSYGRASGSDDHARAIALDNDGNILVSGTTEDGLGNKDFLIIKYGLPPVQITGPQPNLFSDFELHCNYPNPFNAETVLEFLIRNNGKVTLQIYNTCGQLVKLLENRLLPAGRYRYCWDGTDTRGKACASGLYLAMLNFKGRQKSTKMLLIR